MKKLIPLILVVTMLTSCGYVYKEDVKEPEKSNWGERTTYEPTSQQLAYLFNGGMDKVALSSDGTTVTFIIPKFYTHFLDDEVSNAKTDFHITIVPDGTYYDEEYNLINKRITYTFDYVTKEQTTAFDLNPVRDAVKKSLLSVTEYDTKAYESYSEYTNEFMSKLNTVLPLPTKEVSDIELTGEIKPIKADMYYCYVDLSSYGDGYETYKLPVVAYVFNLSNGDYLTLRIKFDSPEYHALFNPQTYVNDFINGTPKKSAVSNLAKLLGKCDEVTESIPELAEEIMSYVILGDYKEYYSSQYSDKQEPILTRDEEEKIDVTSTFEELQTEEVKHEPKTVGRGTNAITSVSDEDAEGGYDGYSSSTEAVFSD